MQPDRSVQTNAPGLALTAPVQFGTPRPINVKVKVIHKEKLSTLQQSTAQGTQPNRNDSIPTAHVSPHSASARQVSSSLTYRSAPSGGLRRAVSSREFGSDSRFRSASPPADCSAVHEADVLAQKVQTARRWSSYQNLQTPEKAAAVAAADLAAGHDFVELYADTDPTLSESRFIQSEFPEHIYSGQQLQKQQRHLQDLSGAEGAPDSMQGLNLKYPGFQPAAGGSDLFPAHHGAVRREATGEAVTARFSYRGPEQRASYMNYVNGGVGGTATAYGPLQSTRHPAGMGGYNAGPPPAPPPPQPGGVVGVHRRLSASSTALYSNTSAQVDSGYGSLHHQVAPDFSSDITSWQQKHQEQLRRQNYEVTQTIRYPPTGMASGMLVSTNGIPTMVDPHKLDAIKRAADSIIREKDNIIEKQKVKIMHLEQQGKESDADLHKALYHKAQEEIDALRFKLQETEYDCASLKVQLTDVMKSKGSNMVDMECKLGKTEYELREFRISFEKEQQAWSVERKSMQEMISAKDLVVSEWKEKCLSQKAESDALERKMNSFDRYLNDLPTADDHSKKSLEVRLLKEEKAKYKARAVELDRRLEMANKVLKQKQQVLTEITSEAAETTNRMNTLQMESARLRAELSLREDDDLPAKKRELEELCSSNDRLTMDLEKARKLLEVKHKKLQVMEVHHLDEIRNLEERLARDESTVQGLKQELADKEAHLKKLRASVNELGSQNQDLLEKSMLLKEKQCELEMHISGEARKLEHRLLKEMSVCFAELQSLVQICIQRAEGQDPNISVLLGLKGVMNAEADDLPSTSDNVQSMQYKVIRIQALRQDIDNLREHISNKYAEDMGDNLNCATQ